MNRKNSAVAFVIIVTGIGLWTLMKPDTSVRHATPVSLPHECYVWQRVWTNELAASIEQAQRDITGFTVLAAEIDLRARGLDRKIIPIDPSVLTSVSAPVGFAIRINPYSGPFGPREKASQYIVSTIEQVLANSQQAGFRPAEIQLDFDCAESKLSGYHEWIDLIKQQFPQYPVTITALPSWMNNRQFKKLIRACDGYVLQVHSLDKPNSIEDAVQLCDPARALKWIRQADRLGIPFRVALPTYGYFVAYDQQGQFVGLSAEGPKPTWSEKKQIKTVLSDPHEIAGLIKAIQADRPKNLSGFSWFRLPLESDILNWRWHTLHRIIQGESLRHRIETLIEWPQPQLAEVYLVNSGDVDATGHFAVTLQAQADCLAADGLMGYSVSERPEGGLLFVPENSASLERLRAQEKIKIGWCRFDSETEVNADVQMQE